MLLLEYAELGSLSSFDPYSNLNLPLKHRIAVQVYIYSFIPVFVQPLSCIDSQFNL